MERNSRSRKGLNPIIAAIFLILSAVMIGLMFYTIYTRPRQAIDFEVEAYIVVGEESSSIHVIIRNTGTADIESTTIRVEKEAGTLTVYKKIGYFESSSISIDGSYIRIDVSEEIPVGKIVDGVLKTNNLWERGKQYIVIVEVSTPAGRAAKAVFAKTP